jgi:RNA polymerase sigma-70 factor (ECF subfamily)
MLTNAILSKQIRRSRLAETKPLDAQIERLSRTTDRARETTAARSEKMNVIPIRLDERASAQKPPHRLPAGTARTKSGMSVKTRTEFLLAEIPHLRAFAISLSGSLNAADDLVQDTLVKAWEHFDSFEPGTNLRAWLITILRNNFCSIYRKHRREVQDVDGGYAGQLSVRGAQEGRLELNDFRHALEQLPPEHREIIVLVGVTELSYEEAAEICGIPKGTVKSRLNRARAKLVKLLGLTSVEEIGPDAVSSGILSKPASKHSSP